MLLDYIYQNYEPGEPIIASDIDLGMSEVNRRQQFKILTDSGKLHRYENGVYYIPKKSRLGVEVFLPPDIIIETKYVTRKNRILGYYSGQAFANQLGISTQVPFIQEIVTNEIGSPIKRLVLDGRTFVLRKPRAEITEDNIFVLQLLDLLMNLNSYTDLGKEQVKECLKTYILSNGITKESFDRYLPLYPDKIYKAIYEMEIANVFAR